MTEETATREKVWGTPKLRVPLPFSFFVPAATME